MLFYFSTEKVTIRLLGKPLKFHMAAKCTVFVPGHKEIHLPEAYTHRCSTWLVREQRDDILDKSWRGFVRTLFFWSKLWLKEMWVWYCHTCMRIMAILHINTSLFHFLFKTKQNKTNRTKALKSWQRQKEKPP